MLADKAFPSWKAIERREMARNQFINGVISSSIQLLMQERPNTFDGAVTLACQLESIESAQRMLQTAKQVGTPSEDTTRGINAATAIDDALDTLAGAKWFSTIDLASGYWQVEMDPSDQEKTTFVTPFGLHQFHAMPFGLTNAPSTFQRLMGLVLAGPSWSTCLVYLDDIARQWRNTLLAWQTCSGG